MTDPIGLTGSGLRIPVANDGIATMAVAAAAGEVTFVLADPGAVLAATGDRAPIAVDYPLSLTAARHLKERLAIAIAEAEHLAASAAEPVERRVPRRSAA